jgi:hypothetical protein
MAESTRRGAVRLLTKDGGLSQRTMVRGWKTTHYANNREFLFRFILVLAVLFHILHGLVLPIMISWDGYLYVQLADILGTSQFPSQWDFLRTPLFPLSLKMVFVIGGKNPLSVILLNTFFGLTGVILIVSVIKQSWGLFPSTIALLLLSFYPTLIVYEHCLLSEVSTFFCLAIIIKLLSDSRPQRRYVLKSLFLMLGVTLGYYFRPTLLYLSPLVSLLFGLSFWKTEAHGEEEMKTFKPPNRFVIILMMILIAFGPFVAAYPWKLISIDGNRRVAQQIIWGFVKQAAIPLNSPLLGTAADKYSESIKQSLNNGHLMMDGVRSDPLFYDVAFTIYKEYGSRLGDFLGPAILKAPQRYLKRVIATVLYFTGFPGLESENQAFADMVLSDDTGSKLWPGPENIRQDTERDFSRPGGMNFSLPIVLRWLNPLFSVLTITGWVATVFIFIVGFLKRDTRLLAFSTIPLAFSLMHALTLMANDRFIVPVHPLVLVNLVLALSILFHPLKRAIRPGTTSLQLPVMKLKNHWGKVRKPPSNPSFLKTML